MRTFVSDMNLLLNNSRLDECVSEAGRRRFQRVGTLFFFLDMAFEGKAIKIWKEMRAEDWVMGDCANVPAWKRWLGNRWLSEGLAHARAENVAIAA